MGLGDASRHRFGAGTALLAEVTARHGHTILLVGGEPMMRVVISLAETDKNLAPFSQTETGA